MTIGAHVRDVIVYDVEIERCIPDKNVARDPTLSYCGGWDDHAGMGISLIAAWDLRDGPLGMPRVFLRDNLDAFGTLIAGRIVAGFNTNSFDDRLCAANGITVKSYDLLAELRAACGEPRHYVYGKTSKGRTLDDVARVNLGGMQKSGHGAHAPVEWQRGKYGNVIDYGLRDVALEVALVLALPTLIDPVSMRPVTLAMPWYTPEADAAQAVLF